MTTMQPAAVMEIAESRQTELERERQRIEGQRRDAAARVQALETEGAALQATAIRQPTPDAKARAAAHAATLAAARDELAACDNALAEIAAELGTVGTVLTDAREAAYQRQLTAVREQATAKAIEFDETFDRLLTIIAELQTIQIEDTRQEFTNGRMHKELFPNLSPNRAAAMLMERNVSRLNIAHNAERINAWIHTPAGAGFMNGRPRFAHLLGLQGSKGK
jgi:hypothetical protein